ncbi:MAG: tetratricopeptide repeat protein [Gemmatimonadetes bacterium]|nr:tetratricopeptide repeat protein [Gemmatimonadota bacterium]
MNNLAILLQATNRIEEAEPLMRQALEINLAAFGEQHPNVAIDLNNLAQVLQDTNRIEEAEPLMRRSLEILDTFRRQTGHEHPYFQQANENYQALQRAMRSNEPD